MVSLTQSPLLKALGWSLLNSFWQMGFLWLIYHLLLALFKNSASRVRYGFSLLLLLTGAAWWIQTLLSALTGPIGTDASNWTLPPVIPPATAAPAVSWLTQIQGWLIGSLPYASTFYLLLLAGLAIRYILYHRAASRMVRADHIPPSLALQEFVGDTARRLGIWFNVRLWLSARIETPLTLGFLRPVILLPVAILSQLPPSQIEAILVHELAHIRRKDYLLHKAVILLEGLLFFNPFCRMLAGYLKKEREHACDDYVIQFNYDPHQYVSALLSLATAQHQNQLALAANGGGEQLLLQRAKRILRQPYKSEKIRGKALLLLLAVSSITILSSSILNTNRIFESAIVAAAPAGTINEPAGIVTWSFGEASGPESIVNKPTPPRRLINRIPSSISAKQPAHRQRKQPLPVETKGEITLVPGPGKELTIIQMDSLRPEQIAFISQQIVLQQLETNLKEAQHQLDERTGLIKLLTENKKKGMEIQATFQPEQLLINQQKQMLDQQRKALKIYIDRIGQLQKKFKQNAPVIRIVYI